MPDANLIVQLQHWHQRQLQRNDQQADDRGDDPRAAREIHPCEGVGREGRHQDRDDRGRDRHGQRIDKRLPHAARRDDGFVVGQGELGRCLGLDIVARAAASGVFWQGIAIGAVGVDQQRLSVPEIGGGASGVFAGVVAAGAKGADCGGTVREGWSDLWIIKDVASQDKKGAVLRDCFGIPPAPERLFGGKRRAPPTRGRNRVAVAEG